jgi:hypothetical protein
MKRITILVSDEPTSVEVLKENPKTYIVRLPDGNVIKRHKVKHAA